MGNHCCLNRIIGHLYPQYMIDIGVNVGVLDK